jgi:MFS family permease
MTSRTPFALIVTVTVVAVSTYTLVPAVLPEVAAEFGVPGAGPVLAAVTVPGILLTPLTGLLADRYGRRVVLTGCLLAFGVGGGLGALAPSFALLVTTRLVQGAGAAGLINLIVVVIADAWDGAERARRMGRNSAALAAAMVALPPIGGTLAALGGWRLAFVPYWAGVVVAAAVWRWLPRSSSMGGDVGILRAAAYVVAAPGPRRWTGLGALVFLLLFGLVLTVLPAQLAGLGLDAGARGVVLALPALTSVLAGLALGRLTTRLDRGRLLAAAFGLWAAAFGLVAAAPELPVIAGALLLYGLGEGVLIPVLQDAVAGAAPSAIRGTVVAVFVGATRIGQTAGPVLAGSLLDHPQLAFATGALVAAGVALAQAPARRASVSAR